MSDARTQSEMDVIAREVDARVYEFLMKTAVTAQHPSDIVDITVGVQSALARFVWAARKPGISADEMAASIGTNMRNLFSQIEAAGETVQ